MALRSLGLVGWQGSPSPWASFRFLGFLILYTMILAAACARRAAYTVELVPLAPEGAPARPENCEVDIRSAPPPGRYREIARVTLVAALGMAQGKVWEVLRRTGCRVGAVALLIGEDEVETRTVFTGHATLESRHRVIRALAIGYSP